MHTRNDVGTHATQFLFSYTRGIYIQNKTKYYLMTRYDMVTSVSSVVEMSFL